MLKNASPRLLSLYAATTITLFLICLSGILHFSKTLTFSIPVFLVLILFAFLSSYAVIIYVLKTYIHRRVKLIYKSIHRLKRGESGKQDELDIDQDVISEVEKEVSGWADDARNEIESLRTQADYRRNFMGDVSHELKTPLFAIQGYLHTLLEGGIYDEAINLAYLNRAAKNAERLHIIVEDLEAIAKLESGEQRLEPQVFDIRELTEEVFADLEIMAKKNKITLTLKEGADKSFSVMADRENIRQVLSNLITNSIKYGNHPGQTKVSFYDMDNNILVEVADNGPGIKEEHLPHLFDRFYRVDKSRSRTGGGSGLGLSIVKHIVDAHKQTINVRSKKGFGSTFGFTLEKA